ncbi:hypothetical protein [Maribacter halichondriae]|uniref:hypothetical protein n=1 Tax=Maribacter halichondriae TaxID=2980554 RepID=UPI0023593C9A|nr:hypothetical protein [Maribacter sp. Hal144]
METSPGIKQKLIIEHELDIGRFLFYTNIVVGEFYEGVHVTKENAIEPIQLAQQIYGTTEPIVYVSHRLNSYSMDPVGYGEVVKMFPNFIGFAIVSQNRYRRMLASIEKLFIKKPIGVFHDMESAFNWSQDLLEK